MRKAAFAPVGDPVRRRVSDNPIAVHTDITGVQRAAEKFVAAENGRPRLDKSTESEQITDRQRASGLENTAAVRHQKIRTAQRAAGQEHRSHPDGRGLAVTQLNIASDLCGSVRL